MKFGIHFEGQYFKVEIKKDKITSLTLDGMEVDQLPQIVPVIIAEYKRLKTLFN